MYISGVILAAGASSRFGSPKMLARVEGQPLLARVACAFLEGGVGDVVVVLGAGAEKIVKALDGLSVRPILNPCWEAGMFTSVKAGLSVIEPQASRVAVSPADLPGLTAASVRRVVEVAKAAGEKSLVVPGDGKRRGHPLIFSTEIVPRVLSWPDSARLSDLFGEPDLTVDYAEGVDEGAYRDADRPEDLARRKAPA